MTTTTKMTGNWKRNNVSLTIGNAEVSLIQQLSGKTDNAVIDFGDNTFDSTTLFAVFQIDENNCYPYVVLVNDDQHDLVQLTAKSYGFDGRVITLSPNTDRSVVDQLMYATAAAKGASKGFNGSKSQKLDKINLEWTSNIVHAADPTLSVVCPNEGKSGNEDIRITNENGDKLFRQENKSISQVLNITERLHMVRGKAHATGETNYDLFVSFTGYDVDFLPYVATHAPAHIAAAYVEFDLEEQSRLVAGDLTVFDNKRVQLPADIDKPEYGLVDGPLLSEYIVSCL